MLLIFLLPSILSGCFGEDLQNIAGDPSDEIYPEPWDRSDREYDNSDVFSESQKMEHTTPAQFNLFLFQFRALRLLMGAQVLLAVQKFILVMVASNRRMRLFIN